MLHVALSIFHRKEDSQYRPHNLIPAITDVANRLKSCRLRCGYLFIRSATAPSVGLQLAMGFGLKRSAQIRVASYSGFCYHNTSWKERQRIGSCHVYSPNSAARFSASTDSIDR
jgi:hypothetical protein